MRTIKSTLLFIIGGCILLLLFYSADIADLLIRPYLSVEKFSRLKDSRFSGTGDDLANIDNPYVKLHKRETHIDVQGWLNTFEEYYETSVHAVLNNTLTALTKYPKLRFIWSEISFLERFWQDATGEQKKTLLSLVNEGRLEIAGGAWVMTDEATPLFYATIENLIEGHQFIHREIGVRPKSSWSVDPFGHGYMLPHLLPLAGVESMVIGRFHDHIKQRLREHQSLRWKWQPPYYEMEPNGPVVNSLPYFVYTTEYACPDKEICACYHIGPSSRTFCPNGHISLRSLNPNNVGSLTEQLVYQMKKVREVYGSEHLLVPIGDDFFFAKEDDFNMMYKGFAAMADYLKEKYFDTITMEFSTISEVFDKITNQSLPTLTGDFFPYTANKDEDFPWWTGYYAHRPYHKTLERRLQNNLRSLDFLRVSMRSSESFVELQQAKRDFSLFQHHDGITGTSTRNVMLDYENRMISANTVFMSKFALLSTALLKLDAPAQLHVGLPHHANIIDLLEEKTGNLIIFNPSTHQIKHTVRIHSDDNYVFKQDTRIVPSQRVHFTNNIYETTFVATLEPLSYNVIQVEHQKLIEQKDEPKEGNNFNMIFQGNKLQGFKVGNDIIKLNLEFYRIPDRGGAYVFEPKRPVFGENLRPSMGPMGINATKDRSGPIQLVKEILYDNGMIVTYFHTPDTNYFDLHITTGNGKEETIMLWLDSNITTNHFYTDINGLFHFRRDYLKCLPYGDRAELPYEANFFPVASSLFIQDTKHRMTIITGQPTSGTSNEAGSVQLMVDRPQLIGDDGKGLGWLEASDNHTSFLKYRFVFEKMKSTILNTPNSESDQFNGHSLSTQALWDSFIYSPISLFTDEELSTSVLPILPELPCHIQLVSLRPVDTRKALLILRRLVYDDKVTETIHCKSNDTVSLYGSLIEKFGKLRHTQLTGTTEGEAVTQQAFSNSLRKPFSIASYLIHYAS